MNVPKVIADLIKAQDNLDSVAYAKCFSETAVVLDEGCTHRGRTEIQHWIAQANENYKTVMDPIKYEEGAGNRSVLSAKVSGTFEGSPTVLNYHFEIVGELVQSLKITN